MFSTVSRLLVDLNRSVGHPHQISQMVPDAPSAIRETILRDFFTPYRARVEALVAQARTRGDRVVHLSSHSFTPILDGVVRTADVGLLYDPSRAGEAALCARWKDSLKGRAPHLRVRRNYPYLGKGDGLTSHLRRRYGPKSYLGIELEISQAMVSHPKARWRSVRDLVVESFREAAGV